MTTLAPDPEQSRFGFVAIIGAPNAGKSTLVNHCVGAKISIVSHKIQTTRSRMLGIALHENTQIVFIDTPGIFAPQRRLDRAMVAAAWGGAQDADHIVLLIDAARQKITPQGVTLDAETAAILAALEKDQRRCWLVLNKIDKIKKQDLLALAENLHARGLFDEIFMLSALSGDGVSGFMAQLAQKLPRGLWMYDPDQVADIPMRLLAAEITREKIYEHLHQELPYETTVETEDWKEGADGRVEISQVIYVARAGHKGIVLGKGGAKIKMIREAARRDIATLLEQGVHLSLFVKLRPKWGEDPARFATWGLDFNA